ncbi:MAG TPA: aspartate--tRNA ligase [Candidatus Saccharimonadales bacterium]|nr:aspartate--tRNA ligase [Candidatus Saccharimonadales bacterium]
MERTLVAKTPELVGQKVLVKGWVQARRDHGKLIFIDLRDRSGLMQVVFWGGGDEALFKKADSLRSEYVVAISGTVQKRSENQVNKDLPTGMVELAAETLEVLAESATPPFEIDAVPGEVGENTRLQYRYLDLRNPRMARNIRMRHKFIKEIRNFLDSEGFVEIETPILTKSSPEGARDFLVPSRLHHGEFYALPQAPQQFKQIAMIAGFEKYYQIAHCFRDEDLRGDRQPEFTQLDMEMSFVDQEDVLEINERLFQTVIAKLYPDKKMPKKFPRLIYDEAISKYKSDKPDLRKNKDDNDELAFAWITEFPVFEKDESGKLTFAHNPFAAPKDEDLEKLYSDDEKTLLSMRSKAYDLVLNGYELSSGSIRIHDMQIQRRVFEMMGLNEHQIKERFGNFIEAFKYGAPPHGGMAPGLDRILMILQEEPTIREVIAFPKNGEMRDLMFGSPSPATPEQLRELGIKTVE